MSPLKYGLKENCELKLKKILFVNVKKKEFN